MLGGAGGREKLILVLMRVEGDGHVVVRASVFFVALCVLQAFGALPCAFQFPLLGPNEAKSTPSIMPTRQAKNKTPHRRLRLEPACLQQWIQVVIGSEGEAH